MEDKVITAIHITYTLIAYSMIEYLKIAKEV